MPLHLVDLPNSIPQLGEGEGEVRLHRVREITALAFLLAIRGNFLFDRLELHLLNCIQKNRPPPTNHSAHISEPLSEPAAAASWGRPP